MALILQNLGTVDDVIDDDVSALELLLLLVGKELACRGLQLQLGVLFIFKILCVIYTVISVLDQFVTCM